MKKLYLLFSFNYFSKILFTISLALLLFINNQNLFSQCMPAGPIGPLGYASVDAPTFIIGPAWGSCFNVDLGIKPIAECPITFQNLPMIIAGGWVGDSCFPISNGTWNSAFMLSTPYCWATHTNGFGVTWMNASGSITRLLAALNTVSLFSPSNGSQVPLTPMIRWNGVDSAASYRLTIYSGMCFQAIVFDSTTALDSIRIPAGKLMVDTRYYWKVKAYNTGGEGPYADAYYFITSYTPPPTLISPLDNSLGIQLTPVLNWDDNLQALKYRVQLSTDINFNTILLDDSSLTASQYSIPSGILTYNTTYYWRASIKYSGNWGPFCNAWLFNTFSLPDPIVLASPPNYSTEQSTNLTFFWYKAMETLSKTGNNFTSVFINQNGKNLISKYWFELTTDTISFSGLIRDTTVNDTTKYIGGLSLNTSYYWRVKANNQLGWGPFSSWWKFTTVVGPPQVPVLSNPENQSIQQPLNLTFNWFKAVEISAKPKNGNIKKSNGSDFKSGDAIAAYYFELTEDTVTFSGSIKDSTLTDTTKQLSLSQISKTYFWRVKAKNAAGWGVFSGWNHFITIPAQNGWYLQATGLSSSSSGIYFINSQTGWICSANPSYPVYKTTDGGNNWVGGANSYMSPRDICFTSLNEGFTATGGMGMNNPYYISWDGGYSFHPFAQTDYYGSDMKSITNFNGNFWVCGFFYTFANPSVPISTIISNSGVVNLLYHNIPLNRIRAGKNNAWTVGNQGLVYRDLSPANIGDGSVNLTGVSFNDDNTGYVIGGNYLFKSTNNGGSWFRIYSLNSQATYNDVYFANKDTGWVACSIPGNGAIINTTNGGVNWSIQYIGGYAGANFSFANSSTGWLLCGNNVLKTGTGGIPLPIAIPVLSAPVNGATGLSLTPALDWSDVTGATKFRLQISAQSNFSSLLIDDSTITQSQYSVASGILNIGTAYYWRAAAGNDTIWTPFSDTWNFTTRGYPLQTILSYPVNNSSGLPADITFSWFKTSETLMRSDVGKQTYKKGKSVKKIENKFNNEILGIDAIGNYWFELTADTVTLAGLVRDSLITDTSKAVNGLNLSTKYFWRVKAKGDLGWGVFSDWWNFTTIANIVWTQQVSGTSQNLRGLNFVNDLTGWACGYSGVILKTTNGGENWIQQTSPTGAILYDINFINQNTGWAVGESSSIIKTTNGGINWFSLTPPPVMSLFWSVFFTDSSTGYVTGQYSDNRVFKTTNGGNNWNQILNFGSSLVKVNFPKVPPEMTGYICAMNSMFKTTNAGSNWTNLSLPTGGNSLYGIYFVDPLTGWNVGNGGTIIYTSNGGSSFQVQNCPNVNLTSVYFFNANSGFAVGIQGNIISTFNGGLNWYSNISNSVSNLWSVYMTAANNGWAVGEGGVILKTGISTVPPILLSPVNGATGLSQTPALDWSDVTYATKYKVQVSEQSDFSTKLIDDSTITSSQFTVPGGILNIGTLYYWRAAAGNDTLWSQFSETWNFTTRGMPNQAVLYNPPNNSVDQPVDITFSWYKTIETLKKTGNELKSVNTVKQKDEYKNIFNSEKSGIDAIGNYWFELTSDTVTLAGLVRDTLLTDTSKVVNSLSLSAKYYWKVKARGDLGWGPFSPWWNFTTVPPPPAVPVLGMPLNHSTGLNIPVTVKWNTSPTTVNYRLQISTDSLFSSFIINDSTQSDTSEVVTSLNPLTNYYWKVAAKNSGGWSTFSERWTFKTLGSPNQVILLNPANNAVDQPVNITFLWNKALDQQLFTSLNNVNKNFIKSDKLTNGGIDAIGNYWYELTADTLTYAGILRDSLLTDTIKTVNGLSNSTSYYWRVKAKNEIGWGGFSGWFKFTTLTVLNVNINYNTDWNMISIPVNANPNGVRSIFPTCIPPAFYYNNGYQSDTILVPGKGFWLFFASGGVQNLSGLPVSPQVIPVTQDWNLVSVYENNVAVNSITSNPPGIINSLFFKYSNGYTIADTLKPGIAYWVNVTQNGNLILPSGADILSKIFTDEGNQININDNWVKIIISDNSGKKSVLYLGKKEEMNNSYMLPPVPPMGIFDARFGSGAYAEMLGQSKHEISIQCDKYPIKIKAENLSNLKLQIKDNISGKLIDRVLTDNSEITVNEHINSFVLTEEELPKVFSLSQNYPNPFNPLTHIKYGLPKKVQVKMVLYDLLGREVKTLVNALQDAGFYTVDLNADNIASGVYFYRIEAGNFTDVKKLMIIK
jgi:photosystem II stability/assembly factor-like uncharacterized protein